MVNKKITHLTTAHARYDTRIFIKMCVSLSNVYNNVSLVVADGKDSEVSQGVNIIDVGKNSDGRFYRMFVSVIKVYKKAVELDSDIYHIHDPELIIVGLKLKRMGKIVIYDAHEDLPVQILSKPYLNNSSKKILSYFAHLYEKKCLNIFDAIIGATPYIKNKFLSINKNVIDVNNYPKIEEFSAVNNWHQKKKIVSYIGGINKVRGIYELVSSMDFVDSDVRLSLVGLFSEKYVRDEVIVSDGWVKVIEYGWQDRDAVNKHLSDSMAGIVTLHPIINYLDSLPVKMFEYMAAGLPVIASNIPLWDNIITTNDCGICVDPHSPKDIASAINFFVNNPCEAERLGKNGREAVLSIYNWSIEESKLLNLYDLLLK